MYPRIEYEMTEKDLEELLDSMKPVPMIMLNIGGVGSQQDNANRAWKILGEKMGFDSMTVQPINGKGNRYFTAVPVETKQKKEERLIKEHREHQEKEISNLEKEIKEKQDKLNDLRNGVQSILTS